MLRHGLHRRASATGRAPIAACRCNSSSDFRAMNRSILALSSVVAFLSACSTTDNNAVVRAQPPCALTILVGDVPEPTGVADDELRFSLDAQGFRTALIDGLRRVDAASRIVGPGELGAGEQADFELRVDFKEPVRLSQEGVTNVLGAGGLWLVTWIGGLLVDDYSYRAELPLQCRVFSPVRSRGLTTNAVGGVVSMSFFERNSFLSWSTAQSLILPPFWTSDDVEPTSAAVSQAAVAAAAAEIAGYLKQDFESAAAREDGCGFFDISPANGSVLSSGSLDLSIEVLSDQRVDKASIKLRVDGHDAPIDLEDLGRQDTRFRARLTAKGVSLDSRTEQHPVILEVATDEVFTRTLRYRTPGADRGQ